MSNINKESNSEKPKKNRIRNRVIGAAATVATLAGAGAAAKYGFDALENHAHPRSEVVAGVPGFVEGHRWYRTWTGHFYVTSYQLEVEQCQADIDATKAGHPTDKPSFVMQPNTLTEGCFIDNVHVSPGTYSNTADNTIIVFEGKVGEHLRR